MQKGRKTEVVYRETVVFELFPALEYDKMQKQRLILFHAYARNIRRIINYAAHFDEPITSKDVIAINRKLMREDTHVFYCLPCFAEYCCCTVEDLEERIEEFKEEGCVLFQ